MRRRTTCGLAVTAAACAALAACAEEPAPGLSRAEYVAAIERVCDETTASLDAVPPPGDAPEVSAFASAVAEALRAEAEAARGLAAPDELEDDHRAFVRNTDDQAARWTQLSTTPSADEAFAELTREIGELTLGRDDLSAQMGIDRCQRSPG